MKAEISWKYYVPLVHQNYRLKMRLEISCDNGHALSTAGILIHVLLLYSLVWCVAVGLDVVPANFSEISLSVFGAMDSRMSLEAWGMFGLAGMIQQMICPPVVRGRPSSCFLVRLRSEWSDCYRRP